MKPSLLILAAGMGSRYGWLKQMDEFGPHGETLMEYALYDAIKSGFEHVVFVIRPDMQDMFQEKFIHKFQDHIDVDYVFQHKKVTDRDGNVYEREKPWWTGHAILCAEEKLTRPFAMINADDYYGYDGCQQMSTFLQERVTADRYGMVAYTLEKTLSAGWAVNRGVCQTNKHNTLDSVHETFGIVRGEDGVIVDEDGQQLDGSLAVSMNFWWFHPSIFGYLHDKFTPFLQANGQTEKVEFYIPSVVDELIQEGVVSCEVMTSHDAWFGVTYQEDKPLVQEAITERISFGDYPEKLWEEPLHTAVK